MATEPQLKAGIFFIFSGTAGDRSKDRPRQEVRLDLVCLVHTSGSSCFSPSGMQNKRYPKIKHPAQVEGCPAWRGGESTVLHRQRRCEGPRRVCCLRADDANIYTTCIRWSDGVETVHSVRTALLLKSPKWNWLPQSAKLPLLFAAVQRCITQAGLASDPLHWQDCALRPGSMNDQIPLLCT